MLSCNCIWVNLLSSIFLGHLLTIRLLPFFAGFCCPNVVRVGCYDGMMLLQYFGPLTYNQVTTVPWQDEHMKVCYILFRYYYDDSFVVVLLLSLPLTWKHWLVAVNRALLKILPAFLLSFQWLSYYYFQSASIYMHSQSILFFTFVPEKYGVNHPLEILWEILKP
jgi:hypothetical protein